MVRDVWSDQIDQPTDMVLYNGVYHLKDKGFKYGDKVTVTVEHGEGIVSRVETLLAEVKDSYETQKDSPWANKDMVAMTKALINDLERVLEVQEPEVE